MHLSLLHAVIPALYHTQLRHNMSGPARQFNKCPKSGFLYLPHGRALHLMTRNLLLKCHKPAFHLTRFFEIIRARRGVEEAARCPADEHGRHPAGARGGANTRQEGGRGFAPLGRLQAQPGQSLAVSRTRAGLEQEEYRRDSTAVGGSVPR